MFFRKDADENIFFILRKYFSASNYICYETSLFLLRYNQRLDNLFWCIDTHHPKWFVSIYMNNVCKKSHIKKKKRREVPMRKWYGHLFLWKSRYTYTYIVLNYAKFKLSWTSRKHSLNIRALNTIVSYNVLQYIVMRMCYSIQVSYFFTAIIIFSSIYGSFDK